MLQMEEYRVLYMEDDTGLARLLQKSLQRQGCIVETAANGEVGIAMVESGAYDIILIDYDMPLGGGMQVLRQLAERHESPPVIMVTGKGNERVAVEALKLGATDYVVKDPDMEYLELLPMVMRQVLWKQMLVTEREQMFAALKENEERYRTLVALSPDGIAIVSGGSFVFVNPAGLSLLGAGSAQELLGAPLLERVYPTSREKFSAQLRKLEEDGEAMPWIEERLLRTDGVLFEVELSAVPFLYKGSCAVQLIFRDITERLLAKQRLEQLAHFDHLTMLPNRVLFFDRLSHLLEQARRYDIPFALLFLDLDRFKLVNDCLGHAMGDLLLKSAAERLTGCMRRSDTIARMGGDEFTVILSRVNDPEDAGLVAKKILETFTTPFDLDGKSRTIGVSIGISIYPLDGDDADTLLKKADTAMYRAKEGGRNRYRYYENVE